jgi:hypothetical protein
MIKKAPGGYYAPGMSSYNPKRKEMKEGKYKTNVKPPYWECKDCSYRGPHYDFEKGMWWWKTNECPKCKSEEFEDATRPKVAPAPQSQKLRTDDRRHLEYIYERLVNVHGENNNTDYMIRLVEIINRK